MCSDNDGKVAYHCTPEIALAKGHTLVKREHGVALENVSVAPRAQVHEAPTLHSEVSSKSSARTDSCPGRGGPIGEHRPR